jgi:tetratricopeptide (TPR) repeat protein/peptidoglycan/xylan/chitin deacetylase (PgdA/CDA1 family)
MNSKTRKTAHARTGAPAHDKKHKRLKRVLALVVVVCLCLAWAVPVRNIISRRLWPALDPGPRDTYEFIALAYTQRPRAQAAGTESRQAAPIHHHLDALVANGFTPITLQDITRLLHRGTPLPRKAVLLTVDVGSSELLQEIRSAVWRYGWHAVAFFNTASLAPNADNTLNWRTVRKLENDNNWETGLSGHLAADAVPAARIHGHGQFLTTRMWLAAKRRVETDVEFRTRVESDYQSALAQAARQLGKKPVAFAYPSGDFGQYAPDDPLPSAVNLQAAASRFDIAFTLGTVGYNTMFTDPRRLNRMEINPDWSATELIAAIKTANRPVERVEDVDMTRRITGWFTERGHFEIGEGGLTLGAAGGSGDAAIWLGGSDVRRDFSATVEFSLQEGIASFYARAAADQSAHLVMQFDGEGNATLKQKSVLQEAPITLATARTAVRLGKRHQMTIFMRDSNINVTVDGVAVFNTHEQATGVKKNGLFGAAVSPGKTGGAAGMTLTNVLLQRRRSTLASWDFDEQFTPYAINWVQTHGSRLTEISPPIARMRSDETDRADNQQAHIYRRLAALYNLRLVPSLRISSDRELAVWTPVSLAGTLSDLDCDGLYVNFEKYDTFEIKALENWLRQASKMLSGAGRPVLVRLPRMLERLSAVYSLLAMIPSVEIVTDAGTPVALDTMQAKQIYEEVIAPPTPEAINALSPVYTLKPLDERSRQQTIEVRLRELIDEGETAFRRGIYDSAIAAFSEWHRLTPESPVPPRRIGDALSRLGYHDEAAGFYRQSLDIAPAQIDLATHYARLLGDIGRKTEARTLLNTYARLFPESSQILLAQAEWLYRENRTEEARERAQRVLLREPDHFDATLFMLRIAENEVDRNAAIERLMSISKIPEEQYKLVSAIWQHDLLTYQNSHLFIKAMDQIGSDNPDPRIQELIQRLDPLDKTVTEDIASTGSLSRHWHIEGGEATAKDGTLTVEADPMRNEFSVRLLRSERWRDSFIEVATTDIKGGFWLYGRRSRDHLIRFGFDPGGERLNLQVWKGVNNNVLASQFVPWVRPQDGVTLRLEIRGKGVTGLVDGKPVFEVPLALPEDFGLGWTAFAAHAAERGRARASIRHLSSGPLPVRIALTPEAPSEDDRGEQTARLRRLIPVLTDISPDWFTVDASGSWNSNVKEENDFYKLFARYYRLRLTPVVRISPAAVITAEEIVTVCRTHGFDGLVLWFDAMPPEDWFDAMDRDLSRPGLDVIAVAGTNRGNTIRGIASSRTLFGKHGGAMPLRLVNTAETGESPDTQKIADPILFRF